MIKTLTRHINLCILLLAVILMTVAASCSRSSAGDDYEPVPDDENSPVVVKDRCTMGLYINLGVSEGSRGYGSRAELPTGDQYVTGSTFENYIDIKDIRVYLFSDEDKLISCLSDPAIAKLTEFDLSSMGFINNSSIYQMSFRVDKILPDAYLSPQSFKIVLLANWGTYPELSSIQTIDDLTSGNNALGDFDPTMAVEKIPFFGVQEYNGVEFSPGEKTISQEKLLLLRAFAKIDVYDAPDSQSTIKGVTLTRYNTRYYKAPVGVIASNQYTGPDHYGYDYDYVTALSLPQDNPYQWESDEEIAFSKDADGHFIAYVPEYKNVGRTDIDTRAKLIIDYNNNNEYVAEFKYYNDPPSGSAIGDYYDIRRNYWYKFVIKRKDPDIEISADVLPYLAVDLDPDFGL